MQRCHHLSFKLPRATENGERPRLVIGLSGRRPVLTCTSPQPRWNASERTDLSLDPSSYEPFGSVNRHQNCGKRPSRPTSKSPSVQDGGHGAVFEQQQQRDAGRREGHRREPLLSAAVRSILCCGICGARRALGSYVGSSWILARSKSSFPRGVRPGRRVVPLTIASLSHPATSLVMKVSHCPSNHVGAELTPSRTSHAEDGQLQRSGRRYEGPRSRNWYASLPSASTFTAS